MESETLNDTNISTVFVGDFVSFSLLFGKLVDSFSKLDFDWIELILVFIFKDYENFIAWAERTGNIRVSPGPPSSPCMSEILERRCSSSTCAIFWVNFTSPEIIKKFLIQSWKQNFTSIAFFLKGLLKIKKGQMTNLGISGIRSCQILDFSIIWVEI